MYPIVLFAHSVVRWAVLLAAVWATMAALSGLRGGRAWTRKARVPGVVLAALVDVQLLLGLALWLWLSPHAITSAAAPTTGPSRTPWPASWWWRSSTSAA